MSATEVTYDTSDLPDYAPIPSASKGAAQIAATPAAPVIEKYTGLLAAADVCTPNTAFWVMQSVRLDRGYGSQVHP